MSYAREDYGWINADEPTQWDLGIPMEFVEVDWRMTPETEDLIHGGKLREGMVVLISENLGLLRNTRSAFTSPNPYDLHRAYKDNRWCRVTELKNSSEFDYESTYDMVQFIGLYGDGTKYTRRYNRQYDWYVKKDSIPEESK